MKIRLLSIQGESKLEPGDIGDVRWGDSEQVCVFFPDKSLYRCLRRGHDEWEVIEEGE